MEDINFAALASDARSALRQFRFVESLAKAAEVLDAAASSVDLARRARAEAEAATDAAERNRQGVISATASANRSLDDLLAATDLAKAAHAKFVSMAEREKRDRIAENASLQELITAARAESKAVLEEHERALASVNEQTEAARRAHAEFIRSIGGGS